MKSPKTRTFVVGATRCSDCSQKFQRHKNHLRDSCYPHKPQKIHLKWFSQAYNAWLTLLIRCVYVSQARFNIRMNARYVEFIQHCIDKYKTIVENPRWVPSRDPNKITENANGIVSNVCGYFSSGTHFKHFQATHNLHQQWQCVRVCVTNNFVCMFLESKEFKIHAWLSNVKGSRFLSRWKINSRVKQFQYNLN